MNKKMKKRIIIVTLAVVALFGAGAVFASLNAGEQLRAWIDPIFGRSAGNVQSAADDYADDQNKKLSQEYERIKDTSVGNVRRTGVNETDRAIDDVNKAAQDYIDSIQAAKGTLSAETQQRFDDLVKAYIDKFNVSADKAQKLALDDLERAINNEGKDARDLLDDKVSDATDKAKAKLEKAIEDAKAELQNLIALKEQASTAELKHLIDRKIESVLEVIQDRATLLENNNKAQIQATAQKAAGDAKAELDKVVASIP